MMRFKIMICLLLLFSRITGGTRSTFELLTQRHPDHYTLVYQMATTRADTCAVDCARHPRCSLFKFDTHASLCTILVPDTFRVASIGYRTQAEKHYAFSNGWCPVEYGYIFLRDVQMCIWLSHEPATHDSAVTQCGLRGGRLIVLADAHKMEAISKLAATDPWKNKHVFVGADDKDVEGTYVWEDGRLVNDSNWNVGEPNFLDESCVGLIIGTGRLFDVPCMWNQMFICEIVR
ncbi:perlucin-like [Haliotis cracherodii]|uniref:perlucin-like n=1 Tax=Haliotis cracherodii TaxID=6455 RepID=UPI0039EB4E78